MKAMYRYEVPIDDRTHTIKLNNIPSGHVAVVYAKEPYLEFWAEHDDSYVGTNFNFRVFGTGHEVPENFWYVATAPRNLGLVFHLYVETSYQGE